MKNPEYFLRYDFQKYEIFQDSSILPAIVSCPLFRSATRSIPSAPALAPANEISHQVDYLKNRSISDWLRSEEHTSELQSRGHLVCRLLLEKKTTIKINSSE